MCHALVLMGWGRGRAVRGLGEEGGLRGGCLAVRLFGCVVVPVPRILHLGRCSTPQARPDGNAPSNLNPIPHRGLPDANSLQGEMRDHR